MVFYIFLVAVHSIELSTSIHTRMGNCQFVLSYRLLKSNVNTQGKTSNHLRNIQLVGQCEFDFISDNFCLNSLSTLIFDLGGFFPSLLRLLSTKQFDQYVRYQHCLHNRSDNSFQFYYGPTTNSFVFRTAIFFLQKNTTFTNY